MLFPAMLESQVVMSNSRGISANTIAEHVIAVTLARFRKLALAFHTQSVRHWTQEAFVEPPSLRTIAGSAVLIIGLGAIGTATARRMAALGARVTAIRRNPEARRRKGSRRSRRRNASSSSSPAPTSSSLPLPRLGRRGA